MSDERLLELARTAGISIDWRDAKNQPQRVSPEILRAVLAGLELPADTSAAIEDSLQRLRQQSRLTPPPLLTADVEAPIELGQWFHGGQAFRVILEDSGETLEGVLSEQRQLPGITQPGYHRLEIGNQTLTLAIAPLQCPPVRGRQGAAWGLTAQLYGLRRPGDGGLGDTEALRLLIEQAAAAGADALAISPVHAMFSAHPEQYSPYSPSSRLLYNVLHAAPDSLLGSGATQQAISTLGIGERMKALEGQPLIDWPAATACRQQLYRKLFEEFRQGLHPLQGDFERFLLQGGIPLERHCRFEVLHEQLRDTSGQPTHWRLWPEEYRCPESPAVQRLAEAHAEDVRFHAFCQWLMDQGLERAQNAARSAGMTIGLIADLAVGADGAGSQAWSRQDELLAGLTVGAPPDVLNQHGQSWGISAFSPQGLRDHGYRAFIEMLRANLAHAGGMRIDHVMGLLRLWVMPAGAAPLEGAYLSYPFHDLLRLLTLEAHRHQAVILGEDLGTIPEGLRETLMDHNILGMRVMLFEGNHEGRLPPPEHWPRQILATTATHDVPPLAGWWQGCDIDWRIRVGQNPAEERDMELAHRQRQRHGMQASMQDALHIPAGEPLAAQEAVDAATCFLGRSNAALVLLPLEDVLGLEEQPNMPGITAIHPNWSRRYPDTSDRLLDGETARRRLHLLAQARQKSPARGGNA